MKDTKNDNKGLDRSIEGIVPSSLDGAGFYLGRMDAALNCGLIYGTE
jgi:hypothetical protein